MGASAATTWASRASPLASRKPLSSRTAPAPTAAASKKPGVKSTLASKGPVPVKKAAASAVASKNTNGTEVPKVNGVNNGVDNGVNHGVNGHSKPVEEEVTPTPTVEA